MEIVISVLIGIIAGLLIITYEPKKKISDDSGKLQDALLGRDIINRILKAPEKERSKLKNIINIMDPSSTPGVAYEIAEFNLPIINSITLDGILTLDQSVPQIGLGISKDINNMNIDIGVGATRRIDEIFNGETKYIIYMGVHF